MILHGRGVVQSDTEAFKWFLKAANQGFDRAQYTGVPQFLFVIPSHVMPVTKHNLTQLVSCSNKAVQ